MKLVVLSDLHTHTWAAFAKGDGISNSRLIRSVGVLRASLEYADLENLPWIFAGDLVHTSGYALNVVLAALIRTFNDFPEVMKILVAGNHDARGIGGRIRYEETVYPAIIDSAGNAVLLDSETFETHGLSFYGAGYQPRPDMLDYGPGGDIGIFHQTVRGSSTAAGFELEEGIDPKELSSRYRVSIVGHVHHPQQIDAPKGRAILVPGSPEHHNFGDVGAHGWWILDIPKSKAKNPTVEFVPGGSPEFRTVETAKDVKNDGHFYRVRTLSAGESLPENATAIGPQPTVVKRRDLLKGVAETEQILQVWMKHEPPTGAPADFLAAGRQLLDAQDPTRLRPYRLTTIVLDNFMSYEEASLDIPRGLHLVVGKGRDYTSNGAGKTTLAGEALYWLIFNKNTKGLSADEVVRWGERECSVYGMFENDEDGSVLEVKRGRNPNPFLEVALDGTDWEAADSVEMTDKLCRFLGLTPAIFQNLGYFSQEKLLLFSSASDGERKSVLADLIGLDAYQKASSSASSEVSRIGLERQSFIGVLEQLTNLIEREEAGLGMAASQRQAWETERTERVRLLSRAIKELKASPVRAEKRLPKLEKRAAKLIERYLTRSAAHEKDLRASIADDLLSALGRKVAAIEDRMEELDSVEELGAAVATVGQVKAVEQELRTAVESARSSLHTAREGLNLNSGERSGLVQEHERLVKERRRVEAALAEGICPTCRRSVTGEELHDCLEPIVATMKEADGRRTILDQEGTKLHNKVRVGQTKFDELSANLEAVRERVAKLEETRRELLELQYLARERVGLLEQKRTITDSAKETAKLEIQNRRLAYGQRMARRLDRAVTYVRGLRVDAERNSAERSGVLEELRKQMNPHDSEVHSTTLRLAAVRKDLAKTEERNEAFVLQLNVFDYWRRGFSRQGIQSLLLEEIATLFNKNRANIFPVLTQGVYDVQFSTISFTRSGEARERTEFIVYEHGVLIPYGALSGGQRRRVDLGIMLVLAQSVAEWMSVPGILGILTLDEVFGYLDDSGAEGLLDALKIVEQQIPTIFAITHDTHLQSMFPEVIRVEQGEDGISRLVQ